MRNDYETGFQEEVREPSLVQTQFFVTDITTYYTYKFFQKIINYSFIPIIIIGLIGIIWLSDLLKIL